MQEWVDGGLWPICCWTHTLELCVMPTVTANSRSLRGYCHPYPRMAPGGTAMMLSWPCISWLWPWSSVCWIRASLVRELCEHASMLCVCEFTSHHRWMYRLYCKYFLELSYNPCWFAFSTAGRCGPGAQRTDVVWLFLSALQCSCIIHNIPIVIVWDYIIHLVVETQLSPAGAPGRVLLPVISGTNENNSFV